VEFQWSRSEVLGLAKESCTHCQGFGLRRGRSGPAEPCYCVLRAVFRACFNKFRNCATQEKYVSRVRVEQVNGRDQRQAWGMKNEEFMVDFCNLAERNLDEFQYRVFRFHFLLGADWKLCCRRLGIDRGSFFHEVYRIQQKLGRVFRETQPYALFPLDEYFGGTVRKAIPSGKVIAMPSPDKRKNSFIAPLKKVA
jgi:hypothetical protein